MSSPVRVIVGPLTAFGGAPPKGEHSESSSPSGGGGPKGLRGPTKTAEHITPSAFRTPLSQPRTTRIVGPLTAFGGAPPKKGEHDLAHRFETAPPFSSSPMNLEPLCVVRGNLARMTRAAYLRVYGPADATDQPVYGYVEPRVTSARILRAGRFGLLAEPLDDDGYITEWRGEHYVCPRNAKLRMLQGVVAFHAAYREMGSSYVIPEMTARLAADELDKIFSESPNVRSYILTSAWHVPPRWFLAFHADEKEITEVRGESSVRYRTNIMVGAQRVSRALGAVEAAGFDDSISGEIRELLEWIEGFTPNGLLELDYGSSAAFFSESDLVLDDSAELIWMAVEALERGDFIEAQQHYFELVGRWSEAMAVVHNS